MHLIRTCKAKETSHSSMQSKGNIIRPSNKGSGSGLIDGEWDLGY